MGKDKEQNSDKANEPDLLKGEDYNEILERIQHIKSLFAFGEGILPFLEELFIFLKEVTPLLNDVSDSLMNTSGMMPDAAIELDAAVEETSGATYQIMENVETILKHLDEFQKATESIEGIDKAQAPIGEIRENASSIMNALQFHDIVSQKLVHVRHVLAEVQKKMLTLFTRIYDMEIDKSVKENILQTLGVNVDEFERIMETKIEEQKRLTADDPDPRKENEDQASKFSQNDIDDLFN